MNANQYRIRLNGLVITHIDVRHALVDGVPCGDLQIAIEDPVLGWMTIDDNQGLDRGQSRFVLEVRDAAIAPEVCRDLPNKGWYQVTVAHLLQLLEATGVFVRETQ